MRVYEISVKATVSDTFRIIAENDQEATERASLMFKNDVMANVLKVQFDVHKLDDDSRTEPLSTQSLIPHHPDANDPGGRK